MHPLIIIIISFFFFFNCWLAAAPVLLFIVHPPPFPLHPLQLGTIQQLKFGCSTSNYTYLTICVGVVSEGCVCVFVCKSIGVALGI